MKTERSGDGISNFEERHIEALLRALRSPYTGRLFAGERQRALVAYCRDKGMITDIQPLGWGNPLQGDRRIAKRRSAPRSSGAAL